MSAIQIFPTSPSIRRPHLLPSSITTIPILLAPSTAAASKQQQAAAAIATMFASRQLVRIASRSFVGARIAPSSAFVAFEASSFAAQQKQFQHILARTAANPSIRFAFSSSPPPSASFPVVSRRASSSSVEGEGEGEDTLPFILKNKWLMSSVIVAAVEIGLGSFGTGLPLVLSTNAAATAYGTVHSLAPYGMALSAIAAPFITKVVPALGEFGFPIGNIVTRHALSFYYASCVVFTLGFIYFYTVSLLGHPSPRGKAYLTQRVGTSDEAVVSQYKNAISRGAQGAIFSAFFAIPMSLPALRIAGRFFARRMKM